MWSKRLEQGQFAALGVAGSVKRSLSRTEFLALLEGVDVVITRRRKRYKRWLEGPASDNIFAIKT